MYPKQFSEILPIISINKDQVDELINFLETNLNLQTTEPQSTGEDEDFNANNCLDALNF